MSKIKLNIEKDNTIWFRVEDVYRINLTQMLEWDNNRDLYYIQDNKGNTIVNKNHKFDIEKDIAEKIIKHANMKKEFLNQCKEDIQGLPLINKLFTDILLHAELVWDKDLAEFDYNEIIEAIKVFSVKGLFSSNSKYYAYSHGIYLYTKWCYENNYRKDYVSTEDITMKMPLEKALNETIISYNVMTKNEMLELAEWIDKESVKIWIYCMLEGLTTKEVVNIKRAEFLSKENHPIDTGVRIVNVPDELYNLMWKHSKTDEVEATIMAVGRYNKDTNYKIKLAQTDYLIRPRLTSKSKNNPVDSQVLTKAVQQELAYMNNTGVIADSFRQNAIMNDYIDGMSLEEINKKYNVKYRHELTIKRQASKFALLEEKRRIEGTYKPRPAKQHKKAGRKFYQKEKRIPPLL